MPLLARAPGGTALRPLARRSLADAAAAELRAAILAGRYQPGERLVQESLADALAVSRTPLREALVQLAAEGLVEESTQGYRVAAPELRHALDMFEVFAAIEAQAARLAAARADETWLARLDKAARTGPLRGSRDASGEPVEFHDVVAHATGNPALVRLRSLAASVIDSLRSEAVRMASPTNHGESRQGHAEIAAAIRSGEGDRAADLAADHVRSGARRAAERLQATDLLLPAPAPSSRA
ncbi:MAG: GntR family transcriptional regulator [Acidimicrobiales bacterium]